MGGWLPSIHNRSHDQHLEGENGFPVCITGHMTQGLHMGGGRSASREQWVCIQG